MGIRELLLVGGLIVLMVVLPSFLPKLAGGLRKARAELKEMKKGETDDAA